MKTFEEPIVEVASFSVEDVITESIQVTLIPPCMN